MQLQLKKQAWPHGLPSIIAIVFVVCVLGTALKNMGQGAETGGKESELAQVEYFESKVRPLLIERCTACHGAENQESSLRLDTAEGLMAGGESGPVVIASDPDHSLLIQAVRGKGDLKMPPDGEDPLTPEEIQALVHWIKQGANWPGYQAANSNPPDSTFTKEQKSFWAFQAVSDPSLPDVSQKQWSTSPLDRFILARLEENNLQPAPSATPNTWLRRVMFNIIGLPPTLEELDHFANDRSPDAKSRVVDRLLASPHYGERWGRHWLDVARYADTLGQEADWILRYAWCYRDYVVNAFNTDKPYSDFVIEQIAGDLLPDAEDRNLTNERIIASGFLMFSPKATAEADKELMKLDVVDEQIDVTSRAFMGLTVACARCHDHKFDPIPTIDYYSLAGIFRSTKTMVDEQSTSMWSEYDIPRAFSETENQVFSDLTKAIAEQKEIMAECEASDITNQANWEKQLKTAMRADKPIDRDAIQNILSLPISKRSSDQQQLVEIASLKDPDSITTVPPLVSGLHAWYAIDSLAQNQLKHDAPVSRWQDQGPHGFHLKNSSPKTTKPHFSQTGFVDGPSLKYSLLTDELKTEQNFGLEGDPSYTVFLTAEFHLKDPQTPTSQIAFLFGTDKGAGTIQFLEFDSNSIQHRLDIGSAGSQDATTTTLTQNVPVIISVRKQAKQPINTTTITVNGSPQDVSGSSSGLDILAGPLFLGYGSNNFSPAMDVAELIVYDRNLNDNEERAIGHYLSQKYNLETKYSSSITSSIVQLTTIPSPSRTTEQRDKLRRYFLRHHDPVYQNAINQLSEFGAKLSKLEKSKSTITVMAPQEQETPADLRVYQRGNYNTPGAHAPRRFLQIIEGEGHAPIDTPQSGRLELAQWIAQKNHPLTWRVIVNRLWKGHFGKGIVATSGNFGELGTRPTHPKLLDWMSHQLIINNGSLKKLHRMVLTSNSFGQAHIDDPRAAKIDPENHWLWRMPRRRLEAEPLRDSMLAISDRLDRQLTGTFQDWYAPYVDTVDLNRGLVALAKPSGTMAAYDSGRRSIYLPVSRNQLYDFFSLFDYTDPSAVMADRVESTVAPQSLFLLNNKMVRREALHFAKRLLDNPSGNDIQRLNQAARMTLAKNASDEEIREGIEFLTEYTSHRQQNGVDAQQSKLEAWQSYCQLLFCQNEFLYLE